MSDFKRLLDRFEDHEKNLTALGNEVVRRYPQSATLVELTRELAAAVDGLGALRDKLGSAIEEAETEVALKSDLLMQMGDSDTYARLSDTERNQLSEYLMSNGAGLATDDELMEFVIRSLEQKSEEQILAEFSKEEIMDFGRGSVPEADDFTAYETGVKLIRESLADPDRHDEIINELAKAQLANDTNGTIRLMYEQAFGQKPLVPNQPAIPAPAPDGAELPPGTEPMPGEQAPAAPSAPVGEGEAMEQSGEGDEPKEEKPKESEESEKPSEPKDEEPDEEKAKE